MKLKFVKVCLFLFLISMVCFAQEIKNDEEVKIVEQMKIEPKENVQKNIEPKENEQINIEPENFLDKIKYLEQEIDAVEKQKLAIIQARDETKERIKEFSQNIQNNMNVEVEKIQNAPLKVYENDGTGVMTKSAHEMREKQCNQLKLKAHNDIKAFFNKEKFLLEQNEKKLRNELYASVRELNKKNFVFSTKDNSLKIHIGVFESEQARWPLQFLAQKIMNFDINTPEVVYITYSSLAGHQPKPIAEMTQEEKAEYDDSVKMYDELLHGEIPFLQAELKYNIEPVVDGISEYQLNIESCTVTKSENEQILLENAYRHTTKFFAQPGIDIGYDSEIEKMQYELIEQQKISAEEERIATEKVMKKARRGMSQTRRTGFAINIADVFSVTTNPEISMEILFGLNRHLFLQGLTAINLLRATESADLFGDLLCLLGVGSNYKLTDFIGVYVLANAGFYSKQFAGESVRGYKFQSYLGAGFEFVLGMDGAGYSLKAEYLFPVFGYRKNPMLSVGLGFMLGDYFLSK